MQGKGLLPSHSESHRYVEGDETQTAFKCPGWLEVGWLERTSE